MISPKYELFKKFGLQITEHTHLLSVHATSQLSCQSFSQVVGRNLQANFNEDDEDA
jgi:hypothetical protein